MNRLLIVIALFFIFVANTFSQQANWWINVDSPFIEARETVVDSNGDIISVFTYKQEVKITHSNSLFAEINHTSINDLVNKNTVIAKFSKSGNIIWYKFIDSTGDDICKSVDVDADNNVYYASVISGDITDENGKNLSANGGDVYLCKYSPLGDLQYSKILVTGADKQYPTQLKICNGELVMVGWAKVEAKFVNGATTIDELIPTGVSNFIAKFSLDGNYISHKSFISTKGADRITSFAPRHDFSGFVLGLNNSGVVNINGTDYTATNKEILFFELNNNFVPQWVRSIKTTETFGNTITDINFDKDNNLYLVGGVCNNSEISNGGIPVAITGIEGAKQDKFVAKFSSAYNFTWVKTFGGFGNDYFTSISFNDSYISLGGESNAAYTVDGKTIGSNGNFDADVLSLDYNGLFIDGYYYYGLNVEKGFDAYMYADNTSLFTIHSFSSTINLGNNQVVKPVNMSALIVNRGTPLSARLIDKKDIDCFGNNNGRIEVEAQFGSGKYFYLWRKNGVVLSGQTTNIIENLSAGNYSLQLKDDAGNIVLYDYLITEPQQLEVTAIMDTIECNGDRGYIVADVSGGTKPYSYSWTKLNEAAFTADTKLVSAVTAGEYFVSVVDKNNCAKNNLSIVLKDEQDITITSNVVSPTNATSADGSISITDVNPDILIDNKTAVDYSYLWKDNNQTTNSSLTNLSGGKYYVTLTQSVTGCTKDFAFDLGQYPINIVEQKNVSCNGMTDGKLTISATFGDKNYTYKWTKDGVEMVGIDEATIDNLSAGKYSVTVTDGTGKVSMSEFVIVEPTPIVANITALDINCFGAKGRILTEVSGGTPKYNYSWTKTGDAGFVSPQANLLDVDAGTYSLKVTDNSGCEHVVNDIILNQQDDITIVASTVEPTTFLTADGSITIDQTQTLPTTLKDGTPVTYSYKWLHDNGSSSSSLSGVSGGTYFVEVTQNETGCVKSFEFKIGVFEILMSQLTNVKCFGGNSGALSAQAYGGKAPYLYTVTSNGNNIIVSQPEVNLTDLVSGIYSVTATDADGKIAFADFTITEPEQLKVKITANTISCSGGEGEILTTVSGGVKPYNYSWSKINDASFSSTLENIYKVNAGEYSLTVTDNNLCEQTISSITLDQQKEILISATWVEPTNYITADGSITIDESLTAPTNLADGTPATYSYKWLNGNGGASSSLSGIGGGTYFVEVTQNETGCTKAFEFELGKYEIIATTVKNLKCFNDNSGALVAKAYGGKPSYLYTVTFNGTTNIIENQPEVNLENIASGTYKIIATDSQGNVVESEEYIITQPDEIIIDKTIDYVKCSDVSSVNLNVTGGGKFYNVEWYNSVTNKTYSGFKVDELKSGVYYILVEDQNGCSSKAVVDATNVSKVEIKDIVRVNPTDLDNPNGQITAQLTYPIDLVKYKLQVSEYGADYKDLAENTTGEFTGLKANNYKIIATSADGCEDIEYKELIIDSEKIKIYNAFTPNGDGINDTWTIENISRFPECVVKVYNSWGLEVFHSEGYSISWDGTRNGNKLPAGVYYYSIKLDDAKPLTGSLTIIL